jgi:hypothetical protein
MDNKVHKTKTIQWTIKYTKQKQYNGQQNTKLGKYLVLRRVWNPIDFPCPCFVYVIVHCILFCVLYCPLYCFCLVYFIVHCIVFVLCTMLITSNFNISLNSSGNDFSFCKRSHRTFLKHTQYLPFPFSKWVYPHPVIKL